MKNLLVQVASAALLLAAGSGSLAAAPLENFGAAPEFSGIDTWLNSAPLSMASLRGKVVLVDFWTYSCINCVRTLPHVGKLHAQYKDQGLVVVGVHTPEFPYERATRNVETAIKRHAITYPVAQDNRYSTWQAYRNQYWPAVYLINRQGVVVYKHFGEGAYAEMDSVVRQLLASPGEPK